MQHADKEQVNLRGEIFTFKEDIMVNTRKLRGKIIEKGFTYAAISDLLGISSCTFGKKIRNISDMSIAEAEQIISILSIPPSEAIEYFFWGAFED